MYFDPLTTWLVALLVNGSVLSGEHVNDAQVTQYYKNKAKETNIRLNADLRRLIAGNSHLTFFQMREIRYFLESYKKHFEYRYGAVEFAPDVRELMINAFREYVTEHKVTLQQYKETYTQKVATGQRVSFIEQRIREEETELTFCQQVLTAVEEQRKRKEREEAAKKKTSGGNSSATGCSGALVLLILIVAFIVFVIAALR
jgi:hypothetical protein